MFRSYTFSFEEVRPEIPVLMEYLQIPDSESYALVSEIVEKTFDELKDYERDYRRIPRTGLSGSKYERRNSCLFCRVFAYRA